MLALVLCSVLAQAPVSRIDQRPITSAVQTDDGAIWAIRDGKVARFDDGWRALDGPTTGEAVGVSVDGERGVVALWKTRDGSELWRHGQKESGRVATMPTPPPGEPSLTVQRDGAVWITGATRRLISIARSGAVTTSVLDPAWLVMPEAKVKPVCRALSANGCCETDASAGQVYCGRVQAFERNGSMWFWSTGSSNSYVLPGLLQLSKGTFTPWNSPGLPDAVTRAVLPFERHVLLSAQSALYRLDLVRRTVTPEPFPPLKDQTPQDILSLHRSGATWALAQRGFRQREGQLFRDDGAGFHLVLDGVGGQVGLFARHAAFVSAKAPDGVEHAWLATQEGPLWHFGGATPELVDWAAGLATADITGLFISRVAAKRTVLLVTDRSQGTFRMPVFEPITRPIPGLLRFPLQGRAFTWSADDRLFWLEGVEPLALKEWTGVAIEVRRPPSPLRDAFTSASTIIADEDDVWVVPQPSRGFSDQGPAVARFGKGTWTIHANAGAALSAGLDRATPFHGLDADALIAVTKDGMRCMKDPNGKLTCALRDGTRRSWTAAEITGGPSSSFWTAPTVDAEGQLRVQVNQLGRNMLWTWNGTKWSVSPDTSLPPLPSGVACKGAPGLAQGVDGREWFSTREGLMVGRNGVCRLRRAGVALDGIVAARFDSKHHDVLVRADEVVVLVDADRFPETTLGAPKQEGAKLTLEVKGAPVAEVRVDGARWNLVELKNSTLELNSLAKGSHHLEVRAVDDQLRVDPTPASLDVVVR